MFSRQTVDCGAAVALGAACATLLRHAHFKAEETRARAIVRQLKPKFKLAYNNMSSAVNAYGLATQNAAYMEQQRVVADSVTGKSYSVRYPSLRLLNSYFYHAERYELGRSAYVFQPGTGTSFEGKALSNAYLAVRHVPFRSFMAHYYPQLDWPVDVLTSPQDLKRLGTKHTIPLLHFAADFRARRFVDIADRLDNWRIYAADACNSKRTLARWVSPSRWAAGLAATWLIGSQLYDRLKG